MSALALVVVAAGSSRLMRNRSLKNPPPSISQASGTAAASPLAHLMDNDPEYQALKYNECESQTPEWSQKYHEVVNESVAEWSSKYKLAVDQREAVLKGKTEGISDPTLREQVLQQTVLDLPQIDPATYIMDCKTSFDAKRESYRVAHSGDYFIVGTYSDYRPRIKHLEFDLAGPRGASYENNSYHVGELYNSAITNSDDFTEACNQGKSTDTLKYSGQSLDTTAEPAQVDAIYEAVQAQLGDKINQLYQQEYETGGYNRWDGSYVRRRDDPEALRKYVTCIVRVRSIFLLAKGDPFNLDVRDAVVVVSGDDRIFLEISHAEDTRGIALGAFNPQLDGEPVVVTMLTKQDLTSPEYGPTQVQLPNGQILTLACKGGKTVLPYPSDFASSNTCGPFSKGQKYKFGESGEMFTYREKTPAQKYRGEEETLVTFQVTR